MVCPTCHQPLQPSFLSMAAGLDIFGMPKRADVVLAIFSVCHLHSYSGCSRSCLTKFQSTIWYYMYMSTSTSKDLLSWLYGLVYPSVIEQLELDIQANHLRDSQQQRVKVGCSCRNVGTGWRAAGRHPYFPACESAHCFASWLLSTQTIPSYKPALSPQKQGQTGSSFVFLSASRARSCSILQHLVTGPQLVLIIHRDNPNLNGSINGPPINHHSFRQSNMASWKVLHLAWSFSR